jgi:hypothetical protein
MVQENAFACWSPFTVTDKGIIKAVSALPAVVLRLVTTNFTVDGSRKLEAIAGGVTSEFSW